MDLRLLGAQSLKKEKKTNKANPVVKALPNTPSLHFWTSRGHNSFFRKRPNLPCSKGDMPAPAAAKSCSIIRGSALPHGTSLPISGIGSHSCRIRMCIYRLGFRVTKNEWQFWHSHPMHKWKELGSTIDCKDCA